MLTVDVVDRINEIPRDVWDGLRSDLNPFVSHGFLHALETTGCVGDDTGWLPRHMVLRDDGQLVGALPLYEKTNSSGEFVFDWSWASAYHENGFAYYPKLVCASPFSPVPGPRFLVNDQTHYQDYSDRLISAAMDHARENQMSSIHVLFAQEQETALLERKGFLMRQDCQFVWENQGFEDFEEFLSQMRSSKRKKIKRERRRVQEAGITFETLNGTELSSEDIHDAFRFYCCPYFDRGRYPYLNEAFFNELTTALGPKLVVLFARHEGKRVAAALLIRDQDRLFGRYWGCDADHHSLHFETCYYQGIDYAIAQGLKFFEPGTQGEHKLIRGFPPTKSFSAHWIAHPGFAKAIQEYLDKERRWVDQYYEQCQQHLPFKREQSQ